jgi:hypothetical protein
MLVERAGYEARKLPDRVAQVDAQVKARGDKSRASPFSPAPSAGDL